MSDPNREGISMAATSALRLAALSMLAWSCGRADVSDRSSAHERPQATARAAVAIDTSPPLVSPSDSGQRIERGVRGERGGRRADIVAETHDFAESERERADVAAAVGRGERESAPGTLAPPSLEDEETRAMTPPPSIPAGSAEVEQRSQGTRAPAEIVASFDGLGAGFQGPQGTATLRNPSDNTLAVGPNHIVQLVNSRMAVFTKRGTKYDTTGRVLYGPVASNNVFKGFGGPCDERLSGDAVVRYDQLAHRWLIVLPIFSRVRQGERHAPPPRAGEGAKESERGQGGQPGAARELFQPPPPSPDSVATPRPPAPPRVAPDTQGVYAMCYAVSTSDDPLGSYYRYEFVRPLFPDYPRPAVWPDGYYLPTSTGDDVIQKHACVADRVRMLAGKSATEQCIVVDGVNFLNNADLDGTTLPPAGAPNPVLAAGGTQLRHVFEDDGIYAWAFHVDWRTPSRTRLDGPVKIAVAPYHYLCDGQLTSCVPQPGTARRLDAQGDKLMARVVYRRVGTSESIVAVHSVNTAAGGGGVRWYEFRIGNGRQLQLHQQGTFAPDSLWRWMASPAMDRAGNIGIGFSFGGSPHFAGQRFAGRMANDPKGILSLREAVLVEGTGAQEHSLRWEDYTQTAVDPSDDCTIWYVGDYLRAGEATYASRIGAFRFPGCTGAARR